MSWYTDEAAAAAAKALEAVEGLAGQLQTDYERLAVQLERHGGTDEDRQRAFALRNGAEHWGRQLFVLRPIANRTH